MLELDAWLARQPRPAPSPPLYECETIIAKQVIWLRFMVNLLREATAVERARGRA